MKKSKDIIVMLALYAPRLAAATQTVIRATVPLQDAGALVVLLYQGGLGKVRDHQGRTRDPTEGTQMTEPKPLPSETK